MRRRRERLNGAVKSETKRRIHTDGQTATTSTTNKQTAQQSEIPLTLAQIEDTRSQTQESKMYNLPTL